MVIKVNEWYYHEIDTSKQLKTYILAFVRVLLISFADEKRSLILSFYKLHVSIFVFFVADDNFYVICMFF